METEYREAETRSPTETRRQPIKSNLLEARRVPEPNQRIGCGQSEERLEQMWWSAGDVTPRIVQNASKRSMESSQTKIESERYQTSPRDQSKDRIFKNRR
ncbi:hypothetical protein F2Q69_00029183 [Brassica cretica]|uniref:Uncharacterized protein n=1 Tax=Brassica cretica TaxID=69181 RepID=A0A8S9RS00_BRACR|nr:hypothetical protein F2Q69_00029183 [Brassica cretica]